MTIEVLETSTEIVEVIEQGPAGAPGSGPVHNPLQTLLASSKDVIVVPYHTGLAASEVTVPFDTVTDGIIDVNAGVMSTVVPIDGFSSNIEIHTIGSGPGNKIIQIAIWSEVSVDAGLTWNVVPDSLHVNNAEDVSSGSHTVSIAENQSVPAGIQTRLRCTQLGDVGVTLLISASPDLLTSNGNVAGDATKATMFYRQSL